ncbi:LysM peptidoglycan-binding domain-containing protein [Flammeovirgaceae bacterium SG7u.111]|nr:LysM peptidoglycan-binding domain-containing protein [Flammeovirgaceae bacterium SG7u.132]WPO35592.1 LysM peptidoglycan-binding domain-containing protein [Flammeovirgaceae bacterium SG7u.111]
MKQLFFLLSILLGLSTFASAHASLDSMGITMINNQIFILHRVEKGETFYKLGTRYKVSAEEIQDRNGNISVLSLGTILVIPAHQGALFNPPLRLIHVHTTQAGDQLQKIADTYGMSHQRLKSLNQLQSETLSPGQAIYVEILDKKSIENKNTNYYEVKKGDTYFGIAKYHQTTLDSIFWWNGIDAKSKLSIGQKLIVGFGEKKASPVLKKYKHLESGVGQMISDRGQRSTQDFALHASLPYGTLVKVTNPSNKKAIMVKIIGKLSTRDTSKNTLLKLSKSACNKLGILTNNFPILLEYD